MTNRVVLITGASSGIGMTVASHLHLKGYSVYGTSRRVINDFKFSMLQMDINENESVKKGVQHIYEKEDRLDVVINNAGYALAGSLEHTPIDKAKAQFETLFFGTTRVCQQAIPIMREKGSGYIINLSSIAGLIAIPFQSIYCASKFAIEGVTEALRMEVKSQGIKVILIEPGDFSTGLTANRQIINQPKKSAYNKAFNNAIRVIESDERKGKSPDAIALLIEKIINDPSPALRYSVGPFIERFAVTLKKILPPKIFEFGVMKYYKVI